MFDDFDVDYPENTGFNDEGFRNTGFNDEGFSMTNESDNIEQAETVTVSKQYLKDLVQEIRCDYNEEYSPVDSMKSLALRTLYYLAND